LLIVGINGDRSLRKLKGPRRPVVRARDRALLVAGLESVDYVTIFNEETPYKVIRRLRPDILVKGADWGSGQIVGRDLVEAAGGRVVRLPLVKGYSTTRLLERLRG
jgi:D-beta-D-heptose 7-phosphate kinase/D-beta-D-heptose 1-phosphate adenosyltransferase